MIPRIIRILLLIHLIIPEVSSQTGYLGKRFDLYAGIRLSPAWTIGNQNEEKGMFKFNNWWNVGMNTIINQNNSFGAEFHIMESKYPTVIIGDEFGAEAVAYDDIHVNGIGVFWKHYRRMNAPLGLYFKLQFDYFKYRADYENSIPEPASFESDMFGFQIGSGYTMIFLEYLTVSPNVSFGSAYGSGKVGFWLGDYAGADHVSRADMKVRRMTTFNLGVILGVIPF